jgi:hypothetical protein
MHPSFSETRPELLCRRLAPVRRSGGLAGGSRCLALLACRPSRSAGEQCSCNHLFRSERAGRRAGDRRLAKRRVPFVSAGLPSALLTGRERA